MRKTLYLFVLLNLLSNTLPAQEFSWKVNAYGYVDNFEFAASPYAKSQTMSGIRLSPELGVTWADRFSLFLGIQVQEEFGTKGFTDQFQLISYFQYRHTTQQVSERFLLGAFPRQGMLTNYSNLFFNDSIRHRRMGITGIFYEVSGRRNFVNVWLDWTGAQSPTQRETFYVGVSGEQRYKRFVAELQGYLFHYALTNPNVHNGVVHDNGQIQVTAGLDYSDRWPLIRELKLTAGTLFGYERKRDGTTAANTPIGGVAHFNIQVWAIGLSTDLYIGDKRQTVATDNHGATYWGNPFLQASTYVQNELYVEIFKHKTVQSRISYKLHVVEGKLFHQQALTLSVKLGAPFKKRRGLDETP